MPIYFLNNTMKQIPYCHFISVHLLAWRRQNLAETCSHVICINKKNNKYFDVRAVYLVQFIMWTNKCTIYKLIIFYLSKVLLHVSLQLLHLQGRS